MELLGFGFAPVFVFPGFYPFVRRRQGIRWDRPLIADFDSRYTAGINQSKCCGMIFSVFGRPFTNGEVIIFVYCGSPPYYRV